MGMDFNLYRIVSGFSRCANDEVSALPGGDKDFLTRGETSQPELTLIICSCREFGGLYPYYCPGNRSIFIKY